ncbi:MAG: hypothetical protein NC089_09510 [Bacteroides sp.]|nr:hypothetical protein [Bacteroides sp.]MCM1549607.1 hypothetical protein [Clostridium sp.]
MKKLKAYFAQKKQMRELTLDSLQKINQIITTISDLAETIAAAANAFDTEEVKSLLEGIHPSE